MKIVYSVIEVQTNDNGNIHVLTHGTYKDLGRANEKFATLYKVCSGHGHVPEGFSSAIRNRQFTCNTKYGNIYKLVGIIETEVI